MTTTYKIYVTAEMGKDVMENNGNPGWVDAVKENNKLMEAIEALPTETDPPGHGNEPITATGASEAGQEDLGSEEDILGNALDVDDIPEDEEDEEEEEDTDE